MKTAIFGLSQSGKTDLFAALAGPAAVTVGRAMVKVPEPRLAPLVALWNPGKVSHAEIEYLDIPGSGATSSLGDRIIGEVRPYDCLLAVLDAFSGIADPADQMATIEADLLISDISVVEKRFERLEADKRKSRDLVDPREEQVLGRALELLSADTPLRNDPELARAKELRGYQFLTAKPVIWVWNTPESDPGAAALPQAGPGQAHLAVCAKLERELAEIEDPDDLAMFMEEMGVAESALDRVIAATYTLLGLITFLTAGEKEVRSWPLRAGSTAPEAAGVIHSDFQQGFIRALVIGWDDFLAAGSMKAAKEKGLLRKEGKDYVVKDGDIIEFLFNV
jgi:GTP-binding protein YchF